MDQAKKDNLKKASDLLGSLLRDQDIPSTAQRAVLKMVQRQPTNAKAQSSFNSFLRNPHFAPLPAFARGKAIELLAKADGSAEVSERLQKLINHAKYKILSAQNKARIFETIGTGRPSDIRQLSDKSLQALQHHSFPERDAQVSKFLLKLADEIRTGGANSVDVEALIKSTTGTTALSH